MADSRRWNPSRPLPGDTLPPPLNPRINKSPDLRKKLYHRSPILEIKSRFDDNNCLPTLSSLEEDDLPKLSHPDSYRFDVPKSVPFGRSRRMSRSLPELRDLQFVSVLPDVEEEETESSDGPAEDVVLEKPTRVPWHRKLDFLWCSACQALGLANIWRFPYYCYSNGGGSFVLPYIVFMVTCSIPLLCMELAVGQATQSGPISAFGQLCPLMKGIGVSSMMLSFWLTAYYSILTAWSIFYVFNSFYSPPRWTRCTNTWNTESCRDALPILTDRVRQSAVKDILNNVNFTVPDNGNVSFADEWNGNVSHPADEFFHVKLLDSSRSIEESGELRFELMASVLFVWILIYMSLRKTEFFRGTTVHVITALSHLLLISIFLRTIGLEGAKDGLSHLFKPDWERMVTPKVLLCALAQAFHSLGVVLGPSILMGSCHKQHNNLLRDTVVVTGVTLLTVLLVGCVSFVTIGHLSAKLKKPFWSVLSDDPGNVYVIYSVVIGSMPVSSCWGVLFFLVILFFGLDSEVKLMATLIQALKEAYTYYIKQRFQGHALFLAVICGFCFFACIPYLTQAGIFFFQLTDYYIGVMATIVVALFEVCTLSWIYGARNLSLCIQQMTGKSASYFYQFCWLILTPLMISATIIYSLAYIGEMVIKKDYVYPGWAHVIGWMVFALTLCWIPFLAVAAFRKAPKSHLVSRLKTTIQPRLRSQSEAVWSPKPVIILNGSTASEFPDSTLPLTDTVQCYVDKHAALRSNAETMF